MAAAEFSIYSLRFRDDTASALPLLCIPHRNRHVGWLIAPDACVLEIVGEATTGIAIPVKLEHSFPPGAVKLQHALLRRTYLGVEGEPGMLGFRRTAQDIELLHDKTVPISGVLDIAAELSAVLGIPFGWADVLNALHHHRLRGTLADAALRCLPSDELDGLAKHLLQHPADLALLQTAMPRDPWLRHRLPMLIAWRHASQASGPPTPSLGPLPTDDLPGANAGTNHKTTLGLVLNGFARTATPPRRMACILATARNEGAYLLEWVAYHRAIGFEHIFLYTNDNTDGSDDLLQLLADAGIVSWFCNQVQPETLPQHRAYGHALSVLPGILDYRWTMIADIDEFAAYDTRFFHSMPDYILWQEQRRAEAIALPWKLHVATPTDTWQDSPSVGRFPLREATISSYVKMIFRTNLVWSANPHHPEPILGTSLIYRSESGEPHVQNVTPAQSAKAAAHYAWMSHYAFRSAPELLMKLARGRADQPASLQTKAIENRIKAFLNQIRASQLVSDERTMLCGAGLHEELRRLMSIPKIAACQLDIKQRYVNDLNRTRNAFLQEVTEEQHLQDLKDMLSATMTGGLGGPARPPQPSF